MAKQTSVFFLFCIFAMCIFRNDGTPAKPFQVMESRVIERAVIYQISLNDFFDKMLIQIQDLLLLYGLDFKLIPHVEFHPSQIAGVPLGKIKLSRGVVNAVYKLNRGGDIIATYSKKKLLIEADLTWKKLDASFSYVHEMIFERHGIFKFAASKPIVHVVVEIDIGSRKATVKDIHFKHVDAISITFKGHLSDIVTNMAMEVIKLRYKDKILNTIGGFLKESLNGQLKNLFPH